MAVTDSVAALAGRLRVVVGDLTMSCSLFDIGCRVEESAASLATNAIDRLAIAVTETLGDLMGTLATSWVRIQH